MKRNCVIFFVLLTFILSTLLLVPVYASNIEDPETGFIAEIPSRQSEEIRPQWGTSAYSSVSIPAPAFRPRTSSGTFDYFLGQIYRTGGAETYFTAPLYLPTGAIIKWADLYYYDSNASANASYYVTRLYGNGEYEHLYTNSTDGAPGYSAILSATINYTVQNGQDAYVIHVNLPATDNTLRLRRVLVFYQLQVSPAPATATFSDVPTSHQYFQYIEALADSGITTGYADGTFRPGSYVTRGQMAVFLSRALGLHWPY